MKKIPTLEEIRALLVRVFKLGGEFQNRSLNSDIVERWDSLGHMGLIDEIETLYEVQIPHKVAIKMLSDESILLALSRESEPTG